MFLQFAAPTKKLASAASMPHFGRERPHHYTTSAIRQETSQKQFAPPLPFNRFLSQVAQQGQISPDRQYGSGQLTNDSADDVMALKRGLRNIISEGGNLYHPGENHTKHRILNRPLRMGERQSRVKDESHASKLVPDYHEQSNDYFPPRNITPPKHPLTQRRQQAKTSSNSRIELSREKDPFPLLGIPTASTLLLEPSKLYSPSKDQVYRLRDEICRLQEENQKQQETIRRLEQNQHRLQDDNRRLEDQVKRYQDDLAFNGRRLDFLLKENEHLAREAEVASGNKSLLQERLQAMQNKLYDAQKGLHETVDYEREIKRLKEKLLTLQIEVEEKQAECNFLTSKMLSVETKEQDSPTVDVSRYEQIIESLQKQMRQLRSERVETVSRPTDFNDILRNHFSDLQKLKDELSVKEEQLRMARDQLSIQKFKQDNFRNELQTQRLRAMTERKNMQVQHDIQNQNQSNEISSLKKLIFAIEEKYRISFNDNLRKDDFVKCHILGKTKAEYDRADIEEFFRAYQAEVPKQSLKNTLMKELMQIQDLQERIVELETALAASQPSRRLSDLSDPALK